MRFLTVGGGAFILYFSLQYGLERIGFLPYTSLAVAYAITVVYHYAMNYTFTFRTRLAPRETPKSLAKYAVVSFVHYLITVALVAAARAMSLDMRIGMLAAVGVTMITGYLAYRHWVFAI